MIGDTLGSRVRKLRGDRGWTLDQLATESGLTKGFLSQVENNKTQPGGRVLVQLAKALGASVDYLLRGEEVATAPATAPLEVPRELGELAVEEGWSAARVFALVEARRGVLARRGGAAPRPFTKTEWSDFARALAPYLPDGEEKD